MMLGKKWSSAIVLGKKERTVQVVKKGDGRVPFLERRLVENEVPYKLADSCTNGALHGLKSCQSQIHSQFINQHAKHLE